MKSGNLCSLNADPLKVEVSFLKTMLSKEIKANQQSIILIANGGLCIQDGILGNYNCADNKENPVFVYIHQEKRTATDFVENNELNTEYFTLVERLKNILNNNRNNFSALQDNESLSSLILQSSKRIQNKIETDVHNQFLLVEGWSAALANLHDSLTSLEKRIDAIKLNLDKFFYSGLEDGYEIMKKFEASKAELENVPLHSALFDGLKVENEEQQHPSNLLEWVLAHDSRIKHQVTVQFLIADSHQAYNELLGISDDVNTSLECLKKNWGKMGLIGKVYENIEIGKGLIGEVRPMQSIIDEDNEEVEKIVEKNAHTSTKDFVKRLDFLSRFREQCEKLVSLIQTHKEYMEQTVRQCRDNPGQTVLLDHCDSAKSHLENVNKHYTDLRQTLSKIEGSKHQLTNNIDIRKTWLQKFQTKICEVDDSIFVVKEKIKRVRTGLSILEQIQTAPKVYVKGVTEIVRRQHFLDFWYSWGVQNSKLAQEIRRKDHEARMVSEQDISSHFIQSLFSSFLSFSLPKLGTPLLQSVRPVLPSISEQDLDELSEHLPQFRSLLQIEKIEPNSLMMNSLYIVPMDNDPLSELVPIDDDEKNIPVSLLPAPSDLNLPPIHNLCLSQSKQVSSESVSNSSSKLVKSLNSSDYQLTDDAITENKKDFICVPRSAIESLSNEINELKKFINVLRSDIQKSVVEKCLSTDEIQKLVIDVNNSSEKLQSQINPCSVDNHIEKADKCSNTNIPFINNSSNSFHITHKEFTNGDLICFFGCMVKGAMQWRMISSDNRIYFLDESSVLDSHTARRRHRESTTGQHVTDLYQNDISNMSQSQLSTHSNQLDFYSSSAMPIIKGTFLSKEEYLCKKTTNRYDLPINTKFFRVKAIIDWMPRSTNN